MASVPKNQVLAEAGRCAWYGLDGKPIPEGCLIVGIAGGSASGKSTVARELLRRLGVPWAAIVSLDSFYRSLSPEQSKRAFQNMHDFDSPGSFEDDLVRKCLADLREFRATAIPVYSFERHQRVEGQSIYLYGANLVILEGLFALHDQATRDMLDLKVFVQCDADVQLARRIRRDIVERGREVQGVLDQYLRFVKPSFETSVLPTAKFADIIVPGANNDLAVNMIVAHLRSELDKRNPLLRPELGRTPAGPCSTAPSTPSASQVLRRQTSFFAREPMATPDNVIELPDSPQLRGVHTILRDVETAREDFVFFAERLATLLIEHALTLLPYRSRTVVTPTGDTYEGAELDVTSLCSFTILRSGACLEKGLRRVLAEAPSGSALIQSAPESGEPLLYYLSMPSCLKRGPEEASKATVLLLDSQIGTGAAMMMAIRILLDHGVREERIVICCFLVSARGGVHALQRAFPKVRILTSAVDPDLEHRLVKQPRADTDADDDGVDALKRIWAIRPGIGSFGERFFGTGLE